MGEWIIIVIAISIRFDFCSFTFCTACSSVDSDESPATISARFCDGIGIAIAIGRCTAIAIAMRWRDPIIPVPILVSLLLPPTRDLDRDDQRESYSNSDGNSGFLS